MIEINLKIVRYVVSLIEVGFFGGPCYNLEETEDSAKIGQRIGIGAIQLIYKISGKRNREEGEYLIIK